jgi:hypothetical protein
MSSDHLAAAKGGQKAPKDEIVQIVNDDDELRALYQNLGCWSYSDEENPPNAPSPSTSQQKKVALDDVLRRVIGIENAQCGEEGFHWKAAAEALAVQYRDSPWMHSHWLTGHLTVLLLNSELLPLKKSTSSGDIDRGWTTFLPQPWGTVVPDLLYSIFFFGSVAGIFYLWRNNWKWAAGSWLAYLVWRYFMSIASHWSCTSKRFDLQNLASALELIRNEVESGFYDAGEVARRLRMREAEGLYVPSLVYTVLTTEPASSVRAS